MGFNDGAKLCLHANNADFASAWCFGLATYAQRKGWAVERQVWTALQSPWCRRQTRNPHFLKFQPGEFLPAGSVQRAWNHQLRCSFHHRCKSSWHRNEWLSSASKGALTLSGKYNYREGVYIFPFHRILSMTFLLSPNSWCSKLFLRGMLSFWSECQRAKLRTCSLDTWLEMLELEASTGAQPMRSTAHPIVLWSSVQFLSSTLKRFF